MPRILKVCLDSNVLVSGMLFRHGNPYKIISTWTKDQFELIISQGMLEEIFRSIKRVRQHTKIKASESYIQNTLWLLRRQKIVKPVKKSAIKIRDPKDNLIISTAISGNADYLITGDNDLLVLKKHQKLKPLIIITPEEFIRTR